MKFKFKRRTIKGYRDIVEPTAGDLKEPVVLARSSREPNVNGSFAQTLVTYHSAFAKRAPAPQRLFQGENADFEANHVFTIRWDQSLAVEIRDYVIWNGQFFRVAFTKEMGKFRDWLAIFVNEHFENGSPVDFVVLPNSTAEPQDRNDQTNEYWQLPPPP